MGDLDRIPRNGNRVVPWVGLHVPNCELFGGRS